MKLTQSQRILHILKKLSANQKVCTLLLAEEFGEITRNIQRDLKLLKDFLGDSIVKVDRGCYQLLNKEYFSNLLKNQNESKELTDFFEFLTLMDSKSLKFLQSQEFSFLNRIKKETHEMYTIFDNPIEELKKTHFLDDLKTAIKDRRYCDIIYHEKQPRTLKNIQPQRILYAKNNWYLAAMTENYKQNDGFKRFRINFIDKLTLQSKTFHRNIQAEEHIKSMQSLFQNFNQPNYTVTIEVDKEVARYFRVKKYLASQKFLDEINGNLILSFQINNDMEIIPLIRTWLPHLKVIAPASLNEKIKEGIKTYLADI